MVTIRDAVRSDNQALLSLTALTPMTGEISIRSDRCPDFFRLLDMRGPSRVIVAEDGGTIVGCVSSTSVEVYVEGVAEPIHYLGDFRTHPAYRRTGVAIRLLRHLRHRLAADGADLVVAAAAYGNEHVRTFFDGRAGLPRAQALGMFRIDHLLPTRRSPRLGAIAVREEAETSELFDRYNDYFRRYQFAPVLRPGSHPGARHLVARSHGDIDAALSVLDAGPARQHVIVGLPWPLRAVTLCARRARGFVPVVNLPCEHEAIRTLFVTAMACRDGHEHAFELLVRKARNLASAEGFHFLGIAVHERDPMARRLAGHPKFSFRSLGFVVGLQRSGDELARLARRVPYESFALV